MMTAAPSPLAQLVRAVQHTAVPLIAQFSPDTPDLAAFRQALAALEQYAAPPPDGAVGALAADATAANPTAAQAPFRADAQVAQLVAEHQQFHQALIDGPTGICILEGPEYRYAFSNPRYDQVIGRTQIVGKPLAMVLPELAGQGIYELLDQVVATGEPFRTPEILVQLDRDGDGIVEDGYYALHYHPLRGPQDTITGVIAYVQDITDRRALEQERAQVLQLTQAARQAAEAERQRLLSVLQQAPAAICVTEGPTHVFTFTNPRYEDLVDRTNLVGQAVRTALPEVAGQGFFELLDQVYTTEVPFSGTEVPIQLQRDGQLDQAYVNFIYAPLRDVTEMTVGLFVHAVEVTDLVIARQQAEAAVVLRDQFLSIAAHELRTPLTSLLGYVQVLHRRLHRAGRLDDQTDRTLTILGAQGQRLSRLIDTLMDVARINMGHLSLDLAPLDLGSLTTRMVEEVRITAAQRDLRVTLPATPCVVLGDSLRLEQVLINLIQNAIKYSPDGGPIAVEVGRSAQAAWVQVQDQGVGIPPAEVPHLFTRFYRVADGAARSIPGMGLGLAVVHEIVTLHGGTITVESTEGVGSTFTVTVPLDAGGAGAEPAPAHTP